jgi:cytochrome c556
MSNAVTKLLRLGDLETKIKVPFDGYDALAIAITLANRGITPPNLNKDGSGDGSLTAAQKIWRDAESRVRTHRM